MIAIRFRIFFRALPTNSMDLFSPLIGIPPRIRALERFGVGTFDDRSLREKCASLRAIMKARGRPAHPFISVIIPAHKEGEYLLATLRSLAEQSYRDCEFLIVVNGEPQGGLTETLARRCGFRVIHESLPGVGRARQKGLLAARGEIIVTSDADTLHHRKWLAAIASEVDAHPDCVGGFGWVKELSSSPLHQLCIQLHSAWRNFQGRYLFLNASEANSFFRRDAALKVGGYDVDCNYCEGSILFKKLTELGGIHGIYDARATVYASDRRDISDRMQTFLKYLFSVSGGVRYGVVR